ncbi:MAG TPA: tetratricopeptide repeat protein [Hyphomicrobiaceae bacterium]|nr:tetratricopeptide repeat protein [Hyphomicrobiaceae bacterium]
MDVVALKHEQEALFQRILKNPADLDASFRHAEVSTALGDFEAAIGSLERMLFFNPDLPRVRLELGVLYFRLGSYELSKAYFESAITAPDTPAEVRAKVAAYLAEINKRLNPSQLTLFAQTGARYQTNANAGPDGSLVRVFGFDATLDRQFVRQPDWNWFAQGVARHLLDLGNQRGDAWETTIAAYLSRHDRFTRLDTNLVDLQTGPRLALFPESAPGWSVRPYVGATGVHLGGEYYLSVQTAGASIAWVPAPGWSFEIGYERSRRDYDNTDDYPTAEEQTGMVDTGYVLAGGPLLLGWNWFARGAISDNDARVPWQSYEQRTLDIYLTYTLVLPVLGPERPITIVPFAGILDADYDGPDPLIDPNVARQDLERRIGIGIDLQLTKDIGFSARFQQSKTDSTLPNYEMENRSVYFGPTVRF